MEQSGRAHTNCYGFSGRKVLLGYFDAFGALFTLASFLCLSWTWCRGKDGPSSGYPGSRVRIPMARGNPSRRWICPHPGCRRRSLVPGGSCGKKGEKLLQRSVRASAAPVGGHQLHTVAGGIRVQIQRWVEGPHEGLGRRVEEEFLGGFERDADIGGKTTAGTVRFDTCGIHSLSLRRAMAYRSTAE